jgi:hypothetical protein
MAISSEVAPLRAEWKVRIDAVRLFRYAYRSSASRALPSATSPRAATANALARVTVGRSSDSASGPIRRSADSHRIDEHTGGTRAVSERRELEVARGGADGAEKLEDVGGERYA